MSSTAQRAPLPCPKKKVAARGRGMLSARTHWRKDVTEDGTNPSQIALLLAHHLPQDACLALKPDNASESSRHDLLAA